MKELKNYIIILFIAITLSIALLNSLANDVYDVVAVKITDPSLFTVALSFYLIISVGIYALFIVLFVTLISQRIEKENTRYNQQRSMLFANITHDLKTPLTSIMGFSKALHDGEAKSEKQQRELCGTIYNKSVKVNELLDLMFQYTKLDTLDYKMKLEEQDLGRLLRETIALYYDEFEKRDIEIIIEIPTKLTLKKVEKHAGTIYLDSHIDGYTKGFVIQL